MSKDLVFHKNHSESNQTGESRFDNSRIPNPTIGSLRMVEDTLMAMPEYPTKNKLWRALPRQMQYSALKEILKYLEESNKIVFDKEDRIVWIFSENQKLQQLKESSKSVFAQ